jgi:hypothetical protein
MMGQSGRAVARKFRLKYAERILMKSPLGKILLGLSLTMPAAVAWGAASIAENGGYCAIWGATSYTITGAEFSAAVNPNWVNATCHGIIPEPYPERADVRKHTGDLYDECNIFLGSYPDQIKFSGSGQSTVSSEGDMMVKCKARTDTCVPQGPGLGICP